METKLTKERSLLHKKEQSIVQYFVIVFMEDQYEAQKKIQISILIILTLLLLFFLTTIFIFNGNSSVFTYGHKPIDLSLLSKFSNDNMESFLVDNYILANSTITFNNNSESKQPSQTILSSTIKNTTDFNSNNLPLSGLVIAIDPGHQNKADLTPEPIAPNSNTLKEKNTLGTVGITTNIPEYEIVLKVALLMKKDLEDKGASVFMTRTTNDVFTSNIDRAKMMNESGSILALRVHCDANNDSSITGASMLVPLRDSTNNIQSESENAGNIILNNFIKSTGAKNRGVFHEDNLTGFNWSTIPICLVEMGFLSNPYEDVLLNDLDYQSRCAKGLVNGISEWYETQKY